MADNDKPLLDFSSGPALAGSAKDTVARGGKALVEWAKSAYDAVTNTTQDAIDTTKAVITGSIEFQEGSPVEADFIKEFGPLLSPGDIAKIKAEGVVSAEMIQSKLIPKLMSIDNQAKLQKLRATFQTHSKLNGLIETYGFAPITKGEAIPRSQANTSQFMREAKLTGRQAWSDMVKGAREYWSLNSETEDLAVGRHLIAMRAKGLISAISSIYGNEIVADNPEYLNTSGKFTEWRKGDDLAEAMKSKNNNKFKDITELTPKYSRSTLHNDYIMALVQASTNPAIRKITIDGVSIDLGNNEVEKLEMIANELDAMREGVEQSNPEGFRQFMGGLAAFKEGVGAVVHVGGVAFGITLEMMQYPLISWLILSTIAVSINRNTPEGKLKGLRSLLRLPGKAVVGGVLMARGERNHTTPEEKQAAINAAKKAQENVKKYAEAKLEELREQERDARRTSNTDLSKRLNFRIGELHKFMGDYEANIAKGKILKYYTEVEMVSRIDDISNGKGHRTSKTMGALKRGEFKVAGTRAWGAVKGAFGVTPDDLGAKLDDFDAKLKGTKADLKTVTVDLVQADGSVKKTTVSYELLNKAAHSTLYESLVQDLERFEKYRKWKTYYDQYERAMKSLEEAKYDLKYVTEAMKGTASVASGSMARHVSVDAAGQSRALENIGKAQEKVDLFSGKMAELKLSFNLTDLKVTVDATTGAVTVDNTKIINKYDPLVLSGRGSIQAQIQAKIFRLGIPAGTIDVTLKSAEQAKMSVLENIAKTAKTPKI